MRRDRLGLAPDRLDIGEDLPRQRCAVADRIDIVITGAHRMIDGDADVSRQAGLFGQLGIGDKTGRGQDQVGVERSTVAQCRAQALSRAVQRGQGRLKVPYHTLGGETAGQFGGNRCWHQARQRPGCGVDHCHGQTGGGHVIGKFAADQAGAKDGHMLHLRGHQGAQLSVGAEVVDTHDAVARIAADRQHALLRTQREYQFAVLDAALHRGQALARGVELDDAGVRTHLDAQRRRLARGIGVDQVIRLLAHRQRHRDSRLRIHQAVTGTDQQHRPLRFASADGLCNRPACNAGADDHHVICAAPALRRLAAVCLLRTGRRHGLNDLRQQSQIALCQTA